MLQISYTFDCFFRVLGSIKMKCGQKSEAYLEPIRTSLMEFFCKKKAPSYMFGWVLNTPLEISVTILPTRF